MKIACMYNNVFEFSVTICHDTFNFDISIVEWSTSENLKTNIVLCYSESRYIQREYGEKVIKNNPPSD